MRAIFGPFSIAFLEKLLEQAKDDGASMVRIDADNTQSIDGRAKLHLGDKDGKYLRAIQYILKPTDEGGKLERAVITEL